MFIETTTTLDALLKEKGRLDWEQAMRILAELIEALNALHQQGQALGNLHPGQIFFDAEGKVYIGALNGLENWQPNASQRSLIYYQAPEQLQGESPTPYSDQFALAVIFQEMITGQPPFDSEDEVWLRHLIIAEPPARLPNDLELPFGVAAVLNRALAKAPEQRFEDVLAFSWALEALTTSLSPDNIDVDSQKSYRRIYLALGAASVITFAAVFFIMTQKGVTFWEPPTPTPSPQPTQAAFTLGDTVTPTATASPTVASSPTIITVSTAEGGGVLAAVEPTQTPTATSTPAPTPTPIPTPTPVPVPMAEVLRQANLRLGPATTHPLVDIAQKGQKFPITGRTSNGKWLRVRAEGSDVWIATHLVQIQGNDKEVTIVAHPPTPPPPPIAKIQPILLSPEPGWATSGEEVSFTWKWPGPSLPNGYAFVLLIWGEDQPEHHIATLAGNTTQINYNPYLSFAAQQGGPGRYFWSVAVVKTASNQIIGIESEPHLLILLAQSTTPTPKPTQNDDRSENGNSGNDGNNGGGEENENNGGNEGSDNGDNSGNDSNPPPPSQRTPTPRPNDPS